MRLVRRQAPPTETELLGVKYDALTVEVMRRVLSKDSNCIDCGASDGRVLKHMVSIAPQGHHLAFEPLPHQAELLRSTFPEVRVEQIALLDTTGTMTFRHVVDSPFHSGFERRKWDTYDERVEMLQVRVARLDDVIPADLPVRLIKVDVEGSEYKLFRGAERTLSTHKPYVIFEIGSEQAEVWDLLHHCGLEVSLIEDWLAGAPPLESERYSQEYNWLRSWMFLAHPK
jgi:FkbM family methyltransferase